MPGLVERLGAADPQPHRHARHRHQEPGRHQGRRHRPRRDRPHCAATIERVVQASARRDLGARRAARPAGATSMCDIDRDAAARYGLNIADVQSIVVGGDRRRQHRRDGRRACSAFRSTCAIRASCATRVETLRQLPVADRARRADSAGRRRGDPRSTDGPPMLKSENARLSGWVYVDIRGRDLQLRRATTCRQAVAQRSAAAAGLLDLLVGAVRVSASARRRS